MRFIHKSTLFICLNIVGGRVIDQSEWDNRLWTNYEWTRDLIQTHVVDGYDANTVVIMAHATVWGENEWFFHHLRDYIQQQRELGKGFPIAYLNGDTHAFDVEQDFFQQPNWLRITIEGNARQKPLILSVNGAPDIGTVSEAFWCDRQDPSLPCEIY